MKDNAIQKRYATALFNMVKNDGPKTEAVIAILANVSELCLDRDIRGMLRSPVVPLAVKRDVLAAVAQKTQAPQELRNFFDSLLDAGRADILDGLDESVRSLYHDQKGIVEAELTTVVSLDQADLDAIAKTFSQKLNKTVLIHQRIDPAILGGVTLRIKNKVLDLSLKTKLDEIAQSAVF